MGVPLFYGWRIVLVCFLIALFGWGLGVYGLGIYLVALQSLHGWSTSLVSSAATVYYLLSAILIVFIGDAFERYGPRRVVLLGGAAMGAGVAGLTIVAVNQFTFACGPGVLGVIRDVTGGYSASLLLCIVLQSMAAGIVLHRHRVGEKR